MYSTFTGLAHPADLAKPAAGGETEWLECPVCREVYVDARALDCLHSICIQCLKDVFEEANKAQKPCVCPVCETAIVQQRPEDTLRNPFIMKALADSGLSKSVDASLFVSQPCKQHAEQKGDLYCDTCKLVICQVCKQADHAEHAVVPENEAIEQMIQASDINAHVLRGNVTQYTTLITNIRTAISDISTNAITVSEQINQAYAGLAEENAVKQVELLQELQTKTQADIKALELQLEEQIVSRQRITDGLAVLDQIKTILANQKNQ